MLCCILVYITCVCVCVYVCMSVAILAQGLNTHFLGAPLSSGSGGLGGWGLGAGRFVAILARDGRSALPDASRARCPLRGAKLPRVALLLRGRCSWLQMEPPARPPPDRRPSLGGRMAGTARHRSRPLAHPPDLRPSLGSRVDVAARQRPLQQLQQQQQQQGVLTQENMVCTLAAIRRDRLRRQLAHERSSSRSSSESSSSGHSRATAPAAAASALASWRVGCT